ncbi:CCAAT/enhancer-binding protein zeta [Benincasa hispida]|uniref:CCAAT/enhancer-binding protein zeta n=1 Tax=Benincasa hispida TaxID=102211 RepID=UPI001902783D|nr:CCAAT/enhancer-binding protein zeta [Benincasa hispida]
MAASKATNKASNTVADIDTLKGEIASFASSLGFVSSTPSSGFNDVDFRKQGPLKPTKHPKKPKRTPEQEPTKTQKPKALNSKSKEQPKPKPKPPVLALDDGNDKPRSFDKFKNLPKLPLVKASVLGTWYVDAAELEAKVMGNEKKIEVKKDVEEWKKLVQKKRELGERLMAQYSQDYEASRGKSGDIKMLVTTQRSGTAADKVSAFSVMVGDNPVANIRSLDALLGMVTSKVGKRHALTGFEALMELFISSLLPDRKLKNLLQRPLNHLLDTKDGNSLLLFWFWEECLKQRYERFVIALEEASRDDLPALKNKALKTIYVLLKSKSEQERRLLSALVNKLGDPENKTASSADYHLSNLLSDHPNMKAVVIDEVDSFLFRPHLGLRAKYHAVNFLSQMRLSQKGDGPQVAKHLIDVYFALFKVLVASDDQKKQNSREEDKKKASRSSKDTKAKDLLESHVEMDSRILSALLTGVNRAFPYVLSKEADDIIEVQSPMLFQLVHSKNFNVAVQGFMLLDKVSSKNQVVSDRFFRALYSKLLLPAAMNSSKAEMFIGLLLRAMKNDVNLKRVAAYAKRILQVALQQPPQYACGCLFLLSEVLKARPSLWNMVLQNESVDDELEHFEDVVEEENINKTITELRVHKDDVQCDSDAASSEDDDSPDEDDESPVSHSEDESLDLDGELLMRYDSKDADEPAVKKPGENGQQSLTPCKGLSLPGGYNPRHREPSYCNADRASWWELVVLASHVHPSVATMAQTLLSGANIVYNGNPLNDLSLTAFLDKFMEKKPKASTWHGGSQIEPAKKLDMNNHLIGPEILSLAEEDVPPEDLVFHKFYTFKMNSSKKPKKKKKKGADEEAAEDLFGGAVEADYNDDAAEDLSDVDMVGADESDNEEIENLLDSANPSGEADGDYDYDDLDQVANESDEDLVGNSSDEEMDIHSDIAGGEDLGSSSDEMLSGSDNNDLGKDSDDEPKERKAKASPFASLEEYEHLINEDGDLKKKSTKEKTKSKSKSNSKARKRKRDSRK